MELSSRSSSPARLPQEEVPQLADQPAFLLRRPVAPPRETTFSTARTLEELLGAFHLTYRQYFGKGFVERRMSELSYSLRDLFPSTVNFIASYRGEILATLTTICNDLTLLPSSKQYREEFARLPLIGRVLSEGTKFAVREVNGKSQPLFSREFIGRVFDWWQTSGIDSVFIVVHPRHVPFWKRICSFQQVSESKPCERVGGSPGCLLHLDLTRSHEHHRVVSALQEVPSIVSRRFEAEGYRLTEEDVAILLLLEPKVLAEGSSAERKLLERHYPGVSDVIHRLIFREGGHSDRSCGCRRDVSSCVHICQKLPRCCVNLLKLAV